MKIVLNGEVFETQSSDLDALLNELDYEPALVATAVNEYFVRGKERAATPLREGDRVEILTPRQGG
jgi:sulfur carrier protein